MEYKYESGEKSTVKMTIDYDAEEWEKSIQKSYLKNKGRYPVNGFRKGKAPRRVIETFYGKGVFYEDALNMLYEDTYDGIIEKEKDNFTAVGDPDLSVEELDDEGVTIVAVIPVKPDVRIEAYTGLKIREYVYSVRDEDVEAEIRKLQDRNAREVEVTDRAAQNGDIANIDFSGSVDGVKFDGGTAEKYDLTLGSGSFIPGFEEQIVGMQIGEEKDISVRFPDDYQAEELKGKDSVFAVKLNALKAKEMPEVTDEFIKDATGSETVADYRAKTRERLEKQAEKKSRDETENSIIEAIREKTTGDIPDVLVEKQIDSIMQNIEYQLMYQGLKLEDYLQYMNTDMASFRASYRDQAAKNAMSQLVIEKIIKLEGLGATEIEIDEKIAEQAKEVEKPFEEYKAGMSDSQKAYVENDIVVGKLFDFLKKNNQMYTEV